MLAHSIKRSFSRLTIIGPVLLASCAHSPTRTPDALPENVMVGQDTVAQRFVKAFGANDADAFCSVLAEDVVFYGGLAWGLEGRDNLTSFAEEFHKGMPGMRVALHDEFYNSTGSRGQFRINLHYHNTGNFMGNPPTGKSGVSIETFTVTIDKGQITEIIQAGNTLPLAAIELIDFGMEFPTETVDPDRLILSVPPAP